MKSERSKDSPVRRFIDNLRVISVSPSIRSESGEPVWKLNVVFPWSDQPELAHLPIKQGEPTPSVGTNRAVIERGRLRKRASGEYDADYDWTIVSLEPSVEAPHRERGKARGGIEHDHEPQTTVVRRKREPLSEEDAELRTHAALKASADMMAGYLSSSGHFKKNYTWRDVVDITTTLADAFLDWIDDASEREMDRR